MAVRPMPIPVLLYHSISDAPEDSIAPYTVTPDIFERQLDAIVGRRQALTVSRLAECLAGRAELPESPVVITFDDGFADNLTAAAPRLASRGLSATVFVTCCWTACTFLTTCAGVFPPHPHPAAKHESISTASRAAVKADLPRN